MNRIMLDLETLDTGPHSTIVAIGAVRFDLSTPTGHWETFYTSVKPEQSMWGRTLSGDTVLWWMKQSDAARAAITTDDSASLDVALEAFRSWAVLPNKIDEMWGNGSDFDNIILGNAYKALSYRLPWSYSQNRCFRTLKNLGIKLGSGEGIKRVGTHHNALDDALYQAVYAAAYLRKLEQWTQ